MRVEVENQEVIYSDGCAVKHSVQLDLSDMVAFLEELFRYLFMVDLNRNCHLCSDVCHHALTLHFGRPFSRDFHSCIPRYLN